MVQVTSYNVLIVLVAAIGSITYGFSSAIISTTLGQPSFLEYFELETRTNSISLVTCIVALSQLGGLIGVLSISVLADRLGRKGLLYIARALAIIFFALQAGSVNIAMFITFRTLGGIPVGMFLSGVPLYQSEIAPPQIRGRLMALHGVLFACGYTIAGWTNYGFSTYQHPFAWRIPLAIQAIFPILLLIGLSFLPESPRWLIAQGRPQEASKVLRKLHGGSTHADAFAEREFTLLSEQERVDRPLQVTWLTIFSTPSLRKRVYIGFTTCFLYPALGTLSIANYLPTVNLYPLLLGLGLPASKQIILSAGYITCSPFGNIISMYLIDSLGRRKMLLTGVTGCLVLLAGEMIVIARGLETEGGKIVGLFWFSIFQDGVTFTYSAEIWPNHLRAKGFSVSMSGFFIGSLLFLDTIFIGSSTIIGVAIYFYWPETKGIPLESVAAVFGDAVAEETALGRENDKGAVKWGA